MPGTPLDKYVVTFLWSFYETIRVQPFGSTRNLLVKPSERADSSPPDDDPPNICMSRLLGTSGTVTIRGATLIISDVLTRCVLWKGRTKVCFMFHR